MTNHVIEIFPGADQIHLIPVYQKYGIEWGETQVEMETNEKVQSQWGPLNPIHHKSRRCYKKEISDDRD